MAMQSTESCAADNLLAAVRYPRIEKTVTVKSGEGVLPRGTILGCPVQVSEDVEKDDGRWTTFIPGGAEFIGCAKKASPSTLLVPFTDYNVVGAAGSFTVYPVTGGALAAETGDLVFHYLAPDVSAKLVECDARCYPVAVLAETVDATSADQKAPAIICGAVNASACSCDDNFDPEDFAAQLREQGVFLI